MRRIKQALIVLFIVTALWPLLPGVPRVEAQAPPITLHFYGNASDGRIYGSDTVYATARNESVGDNLDNTSVTMVVGQRYAGGWYYVYRSFAVSFDTSTVPDNATILNATLRLGVASDNSVTDFNVTIQNGQPTYPHDPLVLADYDRDYYSGNAGYFDTVGGTGTYNVNMTELSWINVTGTTKLALRSSRDIAGTAPSGDEYVSITTQEWGSESGRPRLSVTYSPEYFTFYGVYDETTGSLKDPSERAVNVTAYFTDGPPQTFEVNGTYILSLGDLHPEYFVFDLATDREYWLGSEEAPADIYIFDDTLTLYNIVFLDLAGLLEDYPFIEAQIQVNGTSYIVEKRQVDEEHKVQMALIQNKRYTILIRNSVVYTFGEVLFTSTTTVTLTLKGTAFPKETLLIYDDVYSYIQRSFGSPTGNITITYVDALSDTNSVYISIDYRNGTNAYNATETADGFVHTWTSAENDTDYQVELQIDHAQKGTWVRRMFLPRGEMSANPWGLGWFGTLPFDTGLLIPIFAILFVGGSFSVLNVEVGTFMACITAILMVVMFSVPIPSAFIIVALTLTVSMAIIVAKRRVYV